MPTIAQIGIPVPATFEELESITCDYFSYTYHTPFQRWGRSGQPQFGIDVYGKDSNGRNIGIQCKHYLNTKLTTDTLQNDIEKAEKINPPLDIMYFVTTAPRDVVVQDFCRSWQGKFPVEIYYWDVLERFLQLNPQIKELHYPQQVVVDATQQFINKFLSLCNKYNIYYALYETDYMVSYKETIIEEGDLFCLEVTELLISDESIAVDKAVLRDAVQFKNYFEGMLHQAAMYGHPNGNGIGIPFFPEDRRDEFEKFFLDCREELIKIYCKYKY